MLGESAAACRRADAAGKQSGVLAAAVGGDVQR